MGYGAGAGVSVTSMLRPTFPPVGQRCGLQVLRFCDIHLNIDQSRLLKRKKPSPKLQPVFPRSCGFYKVIKYATEATRSFQTRTWDPVIKSVVSI